MTQTTDINAASVTYAVEMIVGSNTCWVTRYRGMTLSDAQALMHDYRGQGLAWRRRVIDSNGQVIAAVCGGAEA